jgi:hypothetical protein
MNKELEALKRLSGRYFRELPTNLQDSEDYQLLKQALTPPTSDEVCEALSEYLCEKIGKKLEVEYLNGDFILQNNYIAFLDGKGSLCFNFNLPPHLITLIGRFYENEVKGE